MYDSLTYTLILPYGSNRWHYMLRYNDSKGRLQKVSYMNFYNSRFYQSACDFNTLIHQQFLYEMFVKFESERLSFLRQNQSKLRASHYTHLCELLADAAMNKNEVEEWKRTGRTNSMSDFSKLFVLPSTHIGNDRYMRQKMHGIIPISNCIWHPDVFITMMCNPYWPEV